MIPQFQPGQTVYLLTDIESLPRMCTGYKVTSDSITYELSCGTVVSWHYNYEISFEKENLSKTSVSGFAKKESDDDPPF